MAPGACVAVVAIDFGTSRTGYAYSFLGNPIKEVEINPNWAGGAGASYKTLSNILLDSNNEFVAFGYKAREKFYNTDDATKYKFFEWYKMLLYKKKITSLKYDGGEVSLVDVLALTFKYVAKKALKRLFTASKQNISVNQVQWVVTVPAIWDNAAKQITRLAAERAGLPKDLIIALEPEAAALCCLKEKKGDSLTAGDKYMVVDCGGGTVDITVHRVSAEGLVEEIIPPSGGPWGSTEVDKNFKKFLTQIFGDKIIEPLAGPLGVEVIDRFEALKLGTTVGCGSKNINVSVLLEDIPDYVERLQKYNAQNATEIKLTRKVLTLPESVVRSFVEPPIQHTIQHIRTLIAKSHLSGLKLGGFAENAIMKHEMITSFDSDTLKTKCCRAFWCSSFRVGSLYLIQEPYDFTIRLFGATIKSRVAPCTYGVIYTPLFNPSIHPPEKMYFVEGEIRCKDAFNSFIKKNQIINHNHTVADVYAPVRKGQTAIRFSIYSSDEEENIIWKPEMRKVGELQIRIPPEERDLLVFNSLLEVQFGGTEIKATAIHSTSMEEVSCTLDFILANR